MPLGSSNASIKKATEARKAKAKAEEKARRRNSGIRPTRTRKRSDSVSSENKENVKQHRRCRSASPGPTPYWKALEERGGAPSPPQTRSAKKKKKGPRLPPGEFEANEQRSGGQILVFSPPDQKANADNEKRAIARSEYERDRRVEQAQSVGRRQIYDKNGNLISGNFLTSDDEDEQNQFCLDISPSPGNVGNDDKCMESNTKGQVSFDSASKEEDGLFDSPKSRLTERSSSTTNDQILSQMSDLKEQMADTLAQKTDKDSEIEFLKSQLEAQTVAISALALSKTKQEESKQALQSRCDELQITAAADKESYREQMHRLEVELEAAKSRTAVVSERLEQQNHTLEQKVAAVENEKTDLLVRTKNLEKELETSKSLLAEAEKRVISLQSSTNSEHESWQAELNSLRSACDTLKADLDRANHEIGILEKTLETREREVDMFQNELLPESESQLQAAKADLESQKKVTSVAEEEAAKYKASIESLKSNLNKLQERMAEEHLQFQNLNESNSKSYIALERENGQKRQRIEALEEDLENSNKNSEAMKKAMDQMEEKLKHAEEKAQQLEVKLDEKAKLTVKLEKAMEEIDNLNEYKKNADTRASESSTIISDLESTIEKAKEERKELERELRSQRGEIEELNKKLKVLNEDREEVKRRMVTFDHREEEILSKLVQSERIIRELHNTVMKLKGNIRVFVRIRPVLPHDMSQSDTRRCVKNERKSMSKTVASKKVPSRHEKKRKHEELGESEEIFRYPGMACTGEACTGDAGQSFVKVIEPKKDRGGLSQRRTLHTFAFDSVFPPDQGQQSVWEKTEPLVQSAIDGYNTCLFAYGQTGSGKTHTMLGEPGNEGIISRANIKLFDAKQRIEELFPGRSVKISVELLEIYNEKVCDLLAPTSRGDGEKAKLKVMANEAVDNIRLAASTEGDIMRALELAQERRCVKATNSNSQSSRSHLLFTIHFHVFTTDDSTGKTKLERSGKLLLCDLAGSERLSKSGANEFVGSELMEETKNINSSLSVLSRVIEDLQNGSACVPYRESKLTSLLKDSLGGNSKTLAIICCNPSPSHYPETLNSLRFAQRAAKVELKAKSSFKV